MERVPPTRLQQYWVETNFGAVIAVKAQPGARRNAVGGVVEAPPAPGWPDYRLKIAVIAAPEDGKANAAIILALADWLGVKPASITQLAGQTARDKKFAVAGDAAALVARLAGG